MEGELIRINPNERKKNYSIIHWEKGKPTEGGRYIITIQGIGVTTSSFTPGDAHDEHFFEEYVIAWCKLSDIKPYKEKETEHEQRDNV